MSATYHLHRGINQNYVTKHCNTLLADTEQSTKQQINEKFFILFIWHNQYIF